MKRAIFYYFFSSISLLGDSVFLYFLSLNLLNFKHGGILSGIVLGIDSFFQIVLGPYLARFVDAIPQLQRRISLSFYLQCVLVIVSFIPGFLTSYSLETFALLTLLFALMRFLSLIDTQLRVALPLYFEQKKIFPLVRSLSFSNCSIRCVHVVSTSLAPFLISLSWLSICSLNSLSFLFGLIGVYFVLNILNKDIIQESKLASKPNVPNPLSEDEKRKWGIWNNLFLLFNNLAFSAIVLILSKEMLSFKNEPWIIQVFYGPAPIYFGLFISLVLMIFFPDTLKAYVKNARRICFVVFILAICFFVAGLVTGILHGTALLVSGILYGVSLIGASAFIQPKIQGTRYVKSLANSQACGKIGTLISLCCAGICIDNNFPPMRLLIFFSCLGAISSLYLFYYGAKLEAKALVSTNIS